MMNWGLSDRGSMSALLLATLLAVATPLPAVAQEVHAFDVSAQDPASAIRTFGAQAQLQILASAQDLKGKKLNPVSGDISTDAALSELLKGTGLDHRYVGERAVALVSDNAAAASNQLATPGAIANSAAPGESNLEEIVVTAQKKVERLHDVPVPVTAIRASALVDNNKLRLQDYYNTVPGLNLTVDNRGSPALSVRGISTGIYTNSTVGITVDDVPYGAMTSASFSTGGTDLDPNELQRIEVLRGPQGTLYGASSIGGLIKYVTVDPSTQALKGYAKAGTSVVRNGSEMGYNFGGGVNVPLSDTFALRASGFSRQSPGYIDDPVLGLEGRNAVDVTGGRLAALWQLSPDIALKVSALYQSGLTHGSQYVFLEPGFGDLQQSYVRRAGRYDRDIHAYSAMLQARVGSVDITSISGYGVNDNVGSFDISKILGRFTQMQFGVPGTVVADDFRTRKFTQEIRFAAPIGERLEWLLGAFYTRERSDPDGDVLAVDAATGNLVGTWVEQARTHKYEEYALFGNLTVHLSDRFDVQIGGRESRNQQSYAEIASGPYLPFFAGVPSPAVTPETDSQDTSFTYLVTPRFKISQDLMVYARFASGFRPGGSNPGATAGIPATYDPDRTLNYEAGIKAGVLGGALSFDASVYHIEWQDLQLHAADPDTSQEYTTNGSRARSRGVELTIEARPIDGLIVNASGAWNEAVLTQRLPTTSVVTGVPGEHLPYSARFSGHLSLEQTFAVTSLASGFIGGGVTYVGARKGEFAGTLGAERQSYPAYTTVDLRTGLRYQAWSANLYANNITDKRGVLAGGLNSVDPAAFLLIQPRTIGLSISYDF